MSLNISVELYLICSAVVSGVKMSVLYDGLRISRRIFRRNVIVVGIEDILFWCVSGVYIFCMMYDFNGGSMRFSAFIFVALGILLYEVSISPIIVKCFSLILLKFKNIIVRLLKKFIKKIKINKKVKGVKKNEQNGSGKKKKIK